jgi:parallel beta-helix repeat protein
MVFTIIMCLHNRTQCLLRSEGVGRPSGDPQRVCIRLFLCTTTHLSMRLSRGFPDRVGEGRGPLPGHVSHQKFGEGRSMQSARSLCSFVAILAVMSLLLGIQASHAATFYVATYGDDANAGTEGLPFQTIQRGARALRAGDTLIVKGGTYPETLLWAIPSGTSWSQPVTVQAAPGETVVLQPTVQVDGVVDFQDNSQYIILDGFILDGNHLATNAFGIGAASHIRVSNCEMKNALYNGMLVYGRNHEFSNLDVHDNGIGHGLYLTASQTRVESSRFYNHSRYGIHAYGGGVDDNIFDSNLTYDNTSGGIWVGTGVRNTVSNNTIWDNGHGLILESPGSTVYNNIIYNSYGTPHDSGIGITILGSDLGVEITNNTIYGNAGGAIVGVTYATVRDNFFDR